MTTLQPLHALSLDATAQQKFIKFFSELPDKPLSTVRIFDHSEYYSAHGQDATTAAKELFNSTSNIKIMGNDTSKLEYLVLSKGNFEGLVRKLITIRRYRVEIYVNEGNNRNFDWVLKYTSSPGNTMQLEDIFEFGLIGDEGSQSKSLIAVNVKSSPESKGRVIGVACVSANEYQMNVLQFTDDDIFTALETITIQLAPSECLLQLNNSSETELIQRIMARANVLITKCNKSDYNASGLHQDLNRLIRFSDEQKKDSHSLPETKQEVAMESLAAAIKYLLLMSDYTNFGRFHMKTIEAEHFVLIDSAALHALNVFPDKENFNMASIQSLYQLLDSCKTAHGKRLLTNWLRQPLRDINLINERLDIVQAFVDNSEIRLELHDDHLRRVPDLQNLARRFTRKKANLNDVYKVYQLINRLPSLIDCLSRAECPTLDSAVSLQIHILKEDLQKYKEMIETTLDLFAAEKGDILVKPSFDEQLQEYSDKLDELQSDADKQVMTTTDDLNLDSGKLKLEINSQNGYVFRVTLNNEKSLRSNRNYKILDAVKGGVRFQNRELESISEEYKRTKEMYEKEQQRVVSEIIEIASGYTEVLFCLSQILAKLDVLVSFSVTTVRAPIQYCRPTIVEGLDEFILEQVRHPIIEIQEEVSYVPNDVIFKRGEAIMHVVTGPNMGGKSTWMRSCGVAALLAHAGCFVPASKALVPRLSAILARVGAADDEEKGQSTFMREMIEAAAILRGAKKDSLVLIDELGRGTSTYEGCGLAWAIAEHLARESQCFCIFATHYHELTHLAPTMPGLVVNAHVQASILDGELVLMHKIAPGPATKSLGIHIAKLAGIPDQVLKEAEEMQNHLEINSEIESFPDLNVMEAGHEYLVDFLERLKQSAQNPIDFQQKLNRAKEELAHSNNAFVKAVIS